MESRLDKVIGDFNRLANQFETDYFELYKDKPQIELVLGNEDLKKLILGAFAVDEHNIESIKFDGDLKVTLKKIKD